MKFLKNYWFPLIIGIIIIFIITLFGDFSFLFKIEGNRNKNIYKIYNLYDRNSKPVTYEYKTLELNKNLSQSKTIKELIKQTQKQLPKDTQIKDFKIENGILNLNLNKKFVDNYPMDENLFLLNINSIVNTFTYLNNIQGLSFSVDKKSIFIDNSNIDFSEIFINNVNNFIVYSPLKNKLLTFLYNDKNYSLNYIDSDNNEVKNVKIKEINKKGTIFNIKDNYNSSKNIKYNQKWSVKRDGLYIDEALILPNDYKVEKQYSIDNYKAFINNKKYKADCLITEVYQDIDNSVIVVLEIKIENLSDNDNKYVEIISLKQGYGKIKHEIIDDVNNYQYSYKLNERSFVGDK